MQLADAGSCNQRFSTYRVVDGRDANEIVPRGHVLYEIKLRKAHHVELPRSEGIERFEILAVHIDALDVEAGLGEPPFLPGNVDPVTAWPLITRYPDGRRNLFCGRVTPGERQGGDQQHALNAGSTRRSNS